MSEVSPEIIAKTQKSLGKYVKKPALSEKLLKKPPFRFLHDVIRAVIKETGFLNGLFSDDELNSENVKEKEAKVVFLSKLIDAVKIVSKTELKARASKIVAGLEPTETNVLLQTVAKCIDKKIDTTEYVLKVNSGQIKKEKSSKKISESKPDKEKKSSKTSARKEEKVRDSSVNRVKKNVTETPKSTDRRDSSRNKKDEGKSGKKVTEKSSKAAIKHEGDGDKVETRKENEKTKLKKGKEPKDTIEKDETVISPTDEPSSTITNNNKKNIAKDNIDAETIENPSILPPSSTETQLVTKINENNNDTKDEAGFSNVRQGSAGLVRPKSARPRSGDRVTTARGRGEEGEAQGDEMREGGPVEMKIAAPPKRPKTSLRPPSVRPSSARPGAPRLRPESALSVSEPMVMGNINVIVENFDSGAGNEEEETVVIQNAPEIADDEIVTSLDLLSISGENKGQLVEQILEKIQEGEGDGIKKKVEIDWEQDGLRGKDATTKEVTHLRALIQSLTKTANPLGKLMNYLHEDLDAMHNELQMWTNTKKQLYVEIEKQKKLSIESSKPLLEKLDHLRQDIKKQEQEILTARGNILRSEQRIAELLGNK